MVVKAHFEKLLKKECNKIALPKVSVRQSAYETALQPIIPITGQSRLNVTVPSISMGSPHAVP
ncbi:hypothetical protein DAPPUDRAFT_327554 [Daphnia pulex]|uniref:Uncharacterized protein n=1 Tax=Daphnia pulex TaxID=6669 RepID=E9HB69_DAPPU|nr:hypothetical protein DAPPUDRAFT_327554 [Daphnia pulex]|eukprot:EFX70999.1 hypothetical protein DAPPUDRAFT_327554 [Daphnia pulex]